MGRNLRGVQMAGVQSVWINWRGALWSVEASVGDGGRVLVFSLKERGARDYQTFADVERDDESISALSSLTKAERAELFQLIREASVCGAQD